MTREGTDHRLGEEKRGSVAEPDEEEKFFGELESPPFKLRKAVKIDQGYNKYDFGSGGELRMDPELAEPSIPITEDELMEMEEGGGHVKSLGDSDE